MEIAPATQVMITIQFSTPLRPLNALEVADLYAHFSHQFASYAEVVRAGPMPYNLKQLEGSEPIEVAMVEMPRLQFTSEDHAEVVLLQQDRFSFGWQRTTMLDADDQYPGFEKVLDGFQRCWDICVSWVKTKLEVDLIPKVAEIAYVNAFLTRNQEGKNVRLSEIYSFLKRADVPVVMNGYSYSWNEKLLVAEGVLVVAIQGPVLINATGTPATTFGLTATFLMSGTIDMRSELLLVRERIGATFKRIVREERLLR